MTLRKTFDWLVCFFKASDTYLQLPRGEEESQGQRRVLCQVFNKLCRRGQLE